MREIKFRAWDRESQTMHLVSQIDFAVSKTGIQQIGVQIGHCKENEDGYYATDIELMQYTGLKDCKRTAEYPEGQEIYEGDILKHQIWSYTTVQVIWSDIMFRAITVRGEEHNMPLVYLQTDKCEVIGNIYENPELLEVK